MKVGDYIKVKDGKVTWESTDVFDCSDMDLNYKKNLADKSCLGYLGGFRRVIVFDLDLFNKSEEKIFYGYPIGVGCDISRNN